MAAHNSLPRALPRRFRQTRLLIMGCGDVGLRLVARQAGHIRILATSRRPEQRERIRALGATPIDPGARRDLAALARLQVYLIPPPPDGDEDPRLAVHLAGCLRAGRHRPHGTRLVYTSTTGVFGDARGARLRETSPAHPASARARRRRAAEQLLRAGAGARLAGSRRGLRPVILRVPGIYAQDRLPLARLRAGLPCLRREEDGFSNHIHADDLANVAWLALFRAPPARLYIASDGQEMLMGDYFEQVAAAVGLPAPQRLPADAVREAVSPMMWSFMRESRRLENRRMIEELRVRLRYPTVAHTLNALAPPSAAAPPGHQETT